MVKNKIIILFTFITQILFSQLTDLAKLEYSFIPKNNSKDQYTRIKALINYPIKIKEDTYFVIGTEYNRVFLNLRDHYPFDTSFLETITILDLNLAYTHKVNESWRLAYKIIPRFASTLNGDITSEDFFINGGIFAIQDRIKNNPAEKPYRLILGLTYNTTVGLPFPLPLVSYYRQLNSKWSYTLGVPKMNIKYRFNEKENLQSFVGLDGYFAHMQKPTAVQGVNVENVSLSVVVSGFGYEKLITNHLVFYSYLGYTLRLNNVLRNENRDNVFILDNLNSLYIRTGVKFKI